MGYSNINTICLPDITDNFEDLKCTVAGWGTSLLCMKIINYFINFDNFFYNFLATTAQYSNELRYINLTVVGKAECDNKYRKTRFGHGFQLHRSQICAGGELGVDTCKGDGGNPLICIKNNESYYKVAGLVSWGVGCGEERPSIYTNMAYFVEWIKMEVVKNNVQILAFGE